MGNAPVEAALSAQAILIFITNAANVIARSMEFQNARNRKAGKATERQAKVRINQRLARVPHGRSKTAKVGGKAKGGKW